MSDVVNIVAHASYIGIHAPTVPLKPLLILLTALILKDYAARWQLTWVIEHRDNIRIDSNYLHMISPS